MADELRQRLLERVGLPLSDSGRSDAPDPVNRPMIRHWVDAFDDRNPVYLDDEAAAATRHGQVVAPPAMLQTWTMGRPRIEGIAERGGAAGEISTDSPLGILTDAGFRGTLATNSELEFDRYLHLDDLLSSATVLEEVSEAKATALGLGYFVTWVTTYTDTPGQTVGRQRFRVLKFDPARTGEPSSRDRPRPPDAAARTGETLPPWQIELTTTVIVAGALASRDFMPVHHDAEYARAQGAPDLFMNILTSNGYVARYVTDWAGPEARLRRIAIKLGAPATPGHALRFSGQVLSRATVDDQRVVEIAVTATTDLGAHATGTVELDLPSPSAGPD